MSLIKYALGLAVAVALTACGGGGGSAGTVGGDTGGGSGTPATDSTGNPVVAAATAASFVFTLDKSSLVNAGSDKALLTVTALDSARNVVSGIPVTVSVDSGVYTPITSTTDSTGIASGNISIGGNKTNRNITATINVGSQSGSAVIAVTGSQISLTALPATPSPGSSIQVAVKATDANGSGVSGATVQLGGTLGFTQSVLTDSSGNADATLNAVPTAVGTYAITATGLGITSSRDVQVVGAGSGVPNAMGTISAASLAINPNSVSPNVSGATTNRAAIRAVFQNASNQAIENIRVRFEISPPGLGSGEQISTGTTTLYSDVSGVATADYIAGTRTSPTNGVIIRACYGSTDASIAGTLCPNSVSATLTVAGQPLSITLGDNNELAKGSNNLTYIKKFDVAVSDAAGNAVANAIVSASVDITRYGKGLYLGPRFSCLNEDANRNGFLDANERLYPTHSDLSPRKADVILSFLGSNATGANGRTAIQVEYPQNVATWLNYSVRVTTNVAGSEGTAVKSYVTSFVIGDDVNGSFLTAPYGENDCNIAN